MIYGRNYSGPVTCDHGHECDSLTACASPRCEEYFCDEHLTECSGCHRQYCEKHMSELSKTDCGLLCEECEEIYCPDSPPYFGPIAISDDVRQALLGVAV